MARSIPFDVEWSYEGDDGFVFVNATGNMIPGSPGQMYNRYGDPGDAPEPDEFEFFSIYCVDEDGNVVEFDDWREDDLIDYIRTQI